MHVERPEQRAEDRRGHVDRPTAQLRVPRRRAACAAGARRRRKPRRRSSERPTAG